MAVHMLIPFTPIEIPSALKNPMEMVMVTTLLYLNSIPQEASYITK